MRRGKEQVHGQMINVDWFAEVQLLFGMTKYGERHEELYALVRWFEPEDYELEGPSLVCLRRASIGPEFDVISVSSIQRLVVLQPHLDPENLEVYVHNHFFGPM